MEWRLRKACLFRTALILCVSVGLIYWVNINYLQIPVLCSSQQTFAHTNSTVRTFSVVGDESFETLGVMLLLYQQDHAAQREQLAAGKASTIKTLTWYCISDCAGIGDRVRGMYQAFLLALAMNRTFFIHQSDEIQSTMFMEPNAIDWTPIKPCTVLRKDETLEHFGQQSTMQKMFGIENDFVLELNRLNDIQSVFLSGKRMLLSLLRSLNQFTHAYDPALHRLLQYILESRNGIALHYMLSTIHNFLFRNQQQVENLTNAALKKLRLQSHRFVAVHIRTGFKNSFLGEIQLKRKFFEGVRFARTEDSWRQMIECGIEIADREFGKNSTLLIASDDQEPKDWAATEYTSRVTMLDIKPVHVDLRTTKLLGMGSGGSSDAYLDTWMELSVMSRAAAIVSIHSGFTEVASHMGSIYPSSFYQYYLSQRTCACITEDRKWVETI